MWFITFVLYRIFPVLEMNPLPHFHSVRRDFSRAISAA